VPLEETVRRKQGKIAHMAHFTNEEGSARPACGSLLSTKKTGQVLPCPVNYHFFF
jgi:hypothetical protein